MSRWVGVAAITLVLAVIFGAFGAHGLKDRLAQLSTTAIYEKAVLYHFVHGIGILIIPLLASESLISESVARRTALILFIGICIFSGSLYTLAVTNIRWLGAVTPIGGVLFILGWLQLAIDAFRR